MESYRTLHPNHVHQLAVNVSKHNWVTKSGKIKYQKKAFDINLTKMCESDKEHLVYYVIRDHFSAVIYSEITTSKNLIPLEEFLFRAWSQKNNFSFCGVPDFLTIPKTLENFFPNIKTKVSELGISIPKVTSGFQSGIRDIKTLDDEVRYNSEQNLNDIMDYLNQQHISISKMKHRVNHSTKIEIWEKYAKSLKVPKESWLQCV